MRSTTQLSRNQLLRRLSCCGGRSAPTLHNQDPVSNTRINSIQRQNGCSSIGSLRVDLLAQHHAGILVTLILLCGDDFPPLVQESWPFRPGYMPVRINYSDYRAVRGYIFPFERKTRFFAATPEKPDRPCRPHRISSHHWLAGSKSLIQFVPRAAFALRAIRS